MSEDYKTHNESGFRNLTQEQISARARAFGKRFKAKIGSNDKNPEIITNDPTGLFYEYKAMLERVKNIYKSNN